MPSSFALGADAGRPTLVSPRVLIVDPEALVRWSLCTALAAEGFDPVAAADAATARHLAAEWPPPQVAVLDLGTSNIECLDILTSLRAFYPACRCVVMTTGRQPALPAPFAAAVHVLQKPYDLGHVVKLVADLARRDAADDGASGEARNAMVTP